MKIENKRKLVYKSSVIEILSQTFTALISLALRSTFINSLGIDYVGLNVVIEDILSMLSLAELGFQNAIIYRLYKPIVDDDFKKINSILSVLKKVYVVIGSAILIIGVILIPFLKDIINNINVDWNTIYYAYTLNLLATASTYFLGYKRTFLYANQRQYYITIVDTTANITCSVFKIIVISITKNYILAISFNLIKNIFVNLWLTRYTNKKFKFVAKQDKKVDKGLTKEIVDDSKNVMAIKLAIFCYSSIDSLIISKYVGTDVVGYVSNYLTIINNVSNISGKLFMSLAPIVGLYLAEKTVEESYKLLKNYSFIRYVLSVILFIPTIILSDTFIRLWVGDNYIMSNSTLIIFVILIDKYISLVHTPVCEFAEGLGYFKDLKYVLITGSLAKVIISFMSVNSIGVIGVYLATDIAQLIFWIGRSKVLFHNYFKDMKYENSYWKKQIMYIFNIMAMYFVCKLVFGAIKVKNQLVLFLVGGVVCVVLCCLDLVIVFRKNDEYNYFTDILTNSIKKIISKVK